MKTTHKTRFKEEKWENRELGASESHVRKVSKERDKAVDDALNLQMISLRLQKDLIDDLKKLAFKAGIGYQPFIRYILTDFINQVNKKRRSGTHG